MLNRVLVIHNLYDRSIPSGENAAVQAQAEALEHRGLAVEVFTVASDEFFELSFLRKLEWGSRSVRPNGYRRTLSRVLDRLKPEVVHLHNLMPFIGYDIVDLCDRDRIPAVATIHNYRHGCLNGLYLRDGSPCMQCRDRSLKLPGVHYRCYRGSTMQSGLMALASLKATRRRALVQRLFALTPFMRDDLVLAGYDRSRISINPNFVDDPLILAADPGLVLFIGRLSEEKGVSYLINAWRGINSHGAQLMIAGDGPLRKVLETQIAGMEDARLMGRLTPPEVSLLLRRGIVVVVPSICPEGLPTIAIEAWATGVPVLTFAGGSLESVMSTRTGWTVPSRNSHALRAKLEEILSDRAKAVRVGRTARQVYEEMYSRNVWLDRTVAHYAEVIRSS